MKNGFTLTEVLIYIAVLGIIIAAVSSFLFWQINSNSKTVALSEVQSNVRMALSVMTQEIRGAESVYSLTSAFEVNPGQLSLETTKYAPSGETKSYIDFFLCENRLCLKKESQDPVAVTSGTVKISDLVFSRIITASNTPSIQIHLKADYSASTTRPEYQSSLAATSTVSLRSY